MLLDFNMNVQSDFIQISVPQIILNDKVKNVAVLTKDHLVVDLGRDIQDLQTQTPQLFGRLAELEFSPIFGSKLRAEALGVLFVKHYVPKTFNDLKRNLVAKLFGLLGNDRARVHLAYSGYETLRKDEQTDFDYGIISGMRTVRIIHASINGQVKPIQKIKTAEKTQAILIFPAILGFFVVYSALIKTAMFNGLSGEWGALFVLFAGLIFVLLGYYLLLIAWGLFWKRYLSKRTLQLILAKNNSTKFVQTLMEKLL